MKDPKHPAGRWRRGALAATLLGGTALAGYVVAFAAPPPPNGPTPVQQQQVQVNTPAEKAAPGVPVNTQQQAAMTERLPSFTHLVAQVKPAVVSVTNYLKQAPAASDQGDQQAMPNLPFPFNQFPFNQMPQRAHPVEARGSGFIIKPDGLIVTNNHVIRNAKRITVTLDDGKTLPAKVIGADPRTDIALLKIDAKQPLPYVELGNSDKLEPGEWVIAIGNPFGLTETVTAGIVSAMGRNIGAGPYDQFIQVDAPINEGNSGGPLLTQDGKVVGMNTAILSPSGGSIGIGFAIPSDLIKKIEADLEHGGHVTRGYIGVATQAVSPAMSKALNLPDADGALVAAVEPNTPAQEAGLQPGDVIRGINGTQVKTPRDLALDVAAIQPGGAADLKVIRDGKERAINLHVGEMPSEQQMAQGGQRQPGAEHSRLGLALGPISPDVAGQLNLPDGTQGAVVNQVQPGSPAEQAGIQPGDVIVGVGSRSVDSPSQAAAAISSAERDGDHAIALRIIHHGQPAFVAVNVDGGNASNG
ncbi:MAG TPA: Do family serine endopeptidase [Acetobacteraceae bacterium]|nr:Do family serine endopeptidase [Acetobacteraceae bacterium]